MRVDVGFVHTLADVVDLARRLGIGVCVETNACWAERGLARTIAAGVDTFRVVQVSDFAIGTLSTPNRLVPGDGDIPLERILGQILAAGYVGAFDLELIGHYDDIITDLELYLTRKAKIHDQDLFHLLRSVPGIGRVTPVSTPA